MTTQPSYPPPQYQPSAGYGPVPLWAPYYSASLPVAFTRFFKKYADFSGRAGRAEFWWWALIQAIVLAVFETILIAGSGVFTNASSDTAMTPSPFAIIALALASIWSLGTWVPSLALTWRRLHDINRSGGWYFIGWVPFVGPIILLVFTLMAPDPAGQRFDEPTA